MATFGIDGLASGLDTTGIINQLIQLERQPQVRLEQRISNNDAAIASLQKCSSAFDNIETLSKALSGSAKNFVPVQASTSTDSVVATASPGAEQGSFTFTVDPGVVSIAGLTTAANKGIYTTAADTYATYDLTNQATLEIWQTKLTVVDLIWGTVLTTISATGGYFAARWAEGRFG